MEILWSFLVHVNVAIFVNFVFNLTLMMHRGFEVDTVLL